MRSVRFGDLTVGVTIDRPDRCDLPDFLEQITHDAPGNDTGHRFHLMTGPTARLTVDVSGRTITLVLPSWPDRAGQRSRARIGVLQAIARGVAACLPADPTAVLLHGGAVTITAADDAVAVLDGGLGQGKTSLAMGLVAGGGRLLVDEFAFVRLSADRLRVLAAPRWPWHLRDDMRSHLAPQHAGGPLLLTGDLHPIAAVARRTDAAVRVVLVPDQRLAAGQARVATPSAARALLRHAVTDHARKLVDPGLDHVSVFDTPTQVRVCRQARRRDDSSASHAVLDALVGLPTVRIGVGVPTDLPASVRAAQQIVAEVLA